MAGVTEVNTSGATGQARTVGWLDVLLDFVGRPVRATLRTVRRLLAFAMIVLATTLTKFGRAGSVVHPLVWGQIRMAGVRLVPFVVFLAGVGGFVLIGQAVVLLRQVGREEMLGSVLVVALFRELAPLATAVLVLLRVGTGTVVELATARATGEVEALEALGIDPVHFLVVPRVLGLAISVFCLTVYFLLSALVGGYLFCFIEQLPLAPLEYLNQFTQALAWQDFVMLSCKTTGYGTVIAVVTCYQGLSRPLRLEQVSEAATRAVSQSLIACVLLDGAFLAAYLIT